MKQKLLNSLRLRVCMLVAMMAFAVNGAWAETYSFSNIPTKGWSTSGGSQTISNVNWTYSTVTYIGESSGRVQVGSSKNPQTTAWTIQTPITSFGENKKITSVSITAYTTAASATYEISVGGASVKSGSLTTSSEEYSAGNLAATSGSIIVTLTGSSSSKAMYLSDIEVTYEDAVVVTHTANFSVNGTVSTQDIAEGAAITFPADPADVSGKSFVGWTAAAIDGTTNTAPIFVGSARMGTADVTYFAVFADKKPGTSSTTTDALNQSFTEVSGTSYTEWTGKTGTSGAVYAGQSAGGYSSIQLRSNNSNSGVITTTSDGKARKVTVVWNSETTSGRTIDIYGKNSAYTAATDLYNSSNQGTKLGSIVYGTSTELAIEGDYEYIGIRSASGALYLTSISIDWETGTPTTYDNYCTTLPRPTITVATAPASIAATEADGTLAVTYENLTISGENDFVIQYCNAEGEAVSKPEWFEAIVMEDNGSYVAMYSVEENDGAARTAYFKVYAMDDEDFVYSNLVTITQAAAPITAKLNAKGYGTFSCTSALNFAEATDYSAWQITAVSTDNEITFEKINGSVAGSTGLFLMGSAGETITLTEAASGTDISSTNKLEAITEATTITAGQYYGLSGQNFVKVNAGIVPAGKALLPANLITESSAGDVKAFTFVFKDTETGISETRTVSAEEAQAIFNLAGQRLPKAQRGVNIINGKKVVVK